MIIGLLSSEQIDKIDKYDGLIKKLIYYKKYKIVYKVKILEEKIDEYETNNLELLEYFNIVRKIYKLYY